MKKISLLLLLLPSLLPPSTWSAEFSADVVVYGDTSASVIAAVAAARNGRSVLLVAPGRRLGGMTSGGLGQVDAGRGETIGGIAGEFFEKARIAHGPATALYRLTPSVAERTFETMLAETSTKILRNAPLAEQNGVVKEGTAIRSLRLANGDTVSGLLFIDGSYEGDLMRQAGVRYTVGRESRNQYGESGAGVRQLRPLRLSRDENGTLLPELKECDPGRPGDGDDKVQSYNFRLCVTTDPDNRVPFPKPAHYRPEYFRNLLNHILSAPEKSWKFTDFVSLGALPDGKFDLNNKGWYSTDFVNGSWDYPEADYAERRRIHQEHVDYVQSFLYFLAHDPRLPESLRRDVGRWGLAADEFTDSNHFPQQLYVREGRRMIGSYVMIQSDAYENHTKPDSVGMGSYMLDTHWVQKVLAPNGKAYLEGLLGHLPVRPYQISYRAIIPRGEECSNLLVPVTLSASHVIYSSLRMEPVYMILGHSAGTAAALAVEHQTSVQALPYPLLRHKLEEEKQILAYPGGNIFPRLAEVTGIVRDDREAEFTGKWTHSSSTGPYVDGSYAYARPADRADASARFRLTVPTDGNYRLGICYSPAANRAVTAPVVLFRNGQEVQRFTLDMTRPYPGVFRELGEFPLTAGDRVEILLTNENAGGLVVADCVRLLDESQPHPPAIRPVEGTVPPAASETAREKPLPLIFRSGVAIIDDDTAAGPPAVTKNPEQVRRCADWIMSRILPDGAINNAADPNNVLIIPYFSNFCSLALIRAGVALGEERYLAAARESLRWYARHIQPDGTVHDYKGGRYPDYQDSGTYDSADSYPTTFAYALWYYAAATGDRDFPAEMLPHLRRAMRAVEEVRQPDGLTFAKRDYKIKYLMDNLEVWYGLIACAKLEKLLGGDPAPWREWTRQLDASLAAFWKPEENFFEFAAGHMDRKRLYPGALANVFAVLYWIDNPDGREMLFHRLKPLIPTGESLRRITPQTLAWLLLGAQNVGDTELAEQLQQALAGRRMERERAHTFALLLHAACGGINGPKGMF